MTKEMRMCLFTFVKTDTPSIVFFRMIIVLCPIQIQTPQPSQSME